MEGVFHICCVQKIFKVGKYLKYFSILNTFFCVCPRMCVFVTASTVIMWTFVAVHCALALAIRRNSIFHEAARQNEGPIKKENRKRGREQN